MRRWLASSVIALALGGVVRAEEAVEPASAARTYTLDQLARMSRSELESVYRRSGPGSAPLGVTRGRAIYPDGPLAGAKGRVAHTLWKGKTFTDSGDDLVNRWLGGLKAVHAKVGPGESWLDGGSSIVMDYKGSSRVVWSDVRDEIREVSPGVYLGVMYRRKNPQSYKMFFALEARP